MRKVSIIILFVLLMLLAVTAQADGDWVCSECGRTVAAVLDAGDHCPYCDAHRHTWLPASCTEPERCSCGKTKGEPLGHKEIIDEAVEPTCTEAGRSEGSHCSVCGEVIIAPETIAALGHDWKEATCTEPKTCVRCGATEG